MWRGRQRWTRGQGERGSDTERTCPPARWGSWSTHSYCTPCSTARSSCASSSTAGLRPRSPRSGARTRERASHRRNRWVRPRTPPRSARSGPKTTDPASRSTTKIPHIADMRILTRQTPSSSCCPSTATRSTPSTTSIARSSHRTLAPPADRRCRRAMCVRRGRHAPQGPLQRIRIGLHFFRLARRHAAP